jgi:hypothetical protein
MSIQVSRNIRIVHKKINKVKYKIKFIEFISYKLLVSRFSPKRGLRAILEIDSELQENLVLLVEL